MQHHSRQNHSFFYDDLCMVFEKDCAIGQNVESAANVVEKLDNEEEDINLEKDDFTNTNNMMGTDEVQSMSFSEAPRGAQS